MGASLGSARQNPTEVVQGQTFDAAAEEPPGRPPGSTLLPILEQSSCGTGCGSESAHAGPDAVIVDLDVPLSEPIAHRRKSAVGQRAKSDSRQKVASYAKAGVARVSPGVEAKTGKVFRVDGPHLPAATAEPVAEAEAPAESPFYIVSPNRRPQNPKSRSFRKKFFPEATDKEWNDWRWQSRHRIKNLEQMERMLSLTHEERTALIEGGQMLPVGVTPYYMSLLDAENPEQPLRRTVVPSSKEFLRTKGEADDPLGEDGHSPVPGLVHRYPDRVLLLALDFCSTYCRYCTRSRVVGHGELMANEKRLELAFDYLRKTPQVRDVLISGGDPLSLSEDKLDWILGKLRAIPHIEFIRIGTKMPAVLPQRITPQLTRVLRKYHPLWMSVHFLHPDECTPESARACARLADAGIPLGSQTVLLKGVNDSVPVMKELMHKLLLMRVRPYYLYQCDPISGSAHFRTSIDKGMEIIGGLRGHTTGYGVPTYVVDAPGGGGKIPLQPNYYVGREGDDVVLRNFEGKTYRYPDPVEG
ncbi:MAG TPA: KamA family radical SAM protein [Caulifigura sp.]|jgi:lysine 2,3-aminomutase|nr:KamA family radical SAM protein [Caulifigura sp.]